MKVKKVLTTLAVISVLIVPFSVFAATSDTSAAKSIRGFFGINASKLTDAQKADVTDYTKKMADLQKEFINKMVANGSMTKEQGDAAIQRIDDAVNNGTFSKGLFGGGFGKLEKGGNFGLFGIDTSKLTDAQKADLTDSFKKMAELHEELINKEVASGLLTKEQGDAAIKKIDGSIAKGDFKNGMGGFAGFRINKVDPSELTEQQKADLEDFNKKMTDVRKELINKMVANGAMTKEQGDVAIQKIDGMAKGIPENGCFKGMGKGRKGFDGQKCMNGSNAQSNE